MLSVEIRACMLWGITYSVINVTLQENLATTLAADQRRDLFEIARRALLLDLGGLAGDLVAEETSGVLPAAHDQRRVGLLCLYDGFFNILMDWRFDRAHEARAHVDSLRAQRQGSRQPVPISKTAGRDEGRAQFLTCAAEQNEVCEVMLAHMATALEAVDREEIDAETDSSLGVADRRALVDHGDARFFQRLNYRARVVACRLDNLDALVDNRLRVCGVVWRHQRW